MDYWFCVSVCLHVYVFSRERYNVQMLRASLSETPGNYYRSYIFVFGTSKIYIS